MKRMAPLLLTTALCTQLAFADSADELKEAPKESVSITQGMEIAATTKHEENQQAAYTIDINYPQINGEHLTDAAKEFNRLVTALVDSSVQQFKNHVKADAAHMQTLPEELRHNSLNLNYDVDIIKPAHQTLLAVRLSIEGMQAGHPHPYHAYQVLNFDLNKGKKLALKDLFKPNANYLKAFAAYANKKLNSKLQDKWMIKEGTAPLAKNYQLWNLEDDGILITFPENQVAPYVFGAQEVEIPYYTLKNLIASQAPIAACTLAVTGCTIEK